MDLLIRARIDSVILAQLVVYYRKNGVVPKSRNALISQIIRDHVTALENHELLPNIPNGSDVEILTNAGYMSGNPQTFVSDLNKSDLLAGHTTTETSDLASQIAKGVGRRATLTKPPTSPMEGTSISEKGEKTQPKITQNVDLPTQQD